MEHVGMMFAVACDAKSQTRLWPARCRSLSAIESGGAHFSGVLVLLCVACVKQGLHLDRNTFWYVAKELTFQTDCMYGWHVLHGVIAEDFGRHGNPSPKGHQGLIFVRLVMQELRHASGLQNACIVLDKCCSGKYQLS